MFQGINCAANADDERGRELYAPLNTCFKSARDRGIHRHSERSGAIPPYVVLGARERAFLPPPTIEDFQGRWPRSGRKGDPHVATRPPLKALWALRGARTPSVCCADSSLWEGALLITVIQSAAKNPLIRRLRGTTTRSPCRAAHRRAAFRPSAL